MRQDNITLKRWKRTIEDKVASYYNVEVSDLKGVDKSTKFSYPRFIVWHMIYAITNLRPRDFAHFYNRRPQNVERGVELISDLLKRDNKFKLEYWQIQSSINPGLWVKQISWSSVEENKDVN